MRFNGKIEQTLHGYDGGHRLLASSTNLSSNEKTYLLESSDLSGSYTHGFDEYLTGYSIPGSIRYAFSKTWYAYEMDRPGCVWTHTLLIEQNVFKETLNLQHLLSFFKRPQKGIYEEFKEPLFYDNFINIQNQRHDSLSQHNDFLLYANVFQSLYERVNKVVIIADNSLKYESFVLSFWSQMWDSLRPKFSFCTGSFSCRTLKGEPFVLQVVPSQNIAAFRSEFLYSNNLKKKTNKLVFIDEDDLSSKSLYQKRYEKIYQSFCRFLSGNENLNHDDVLLFVWHYGEQLQPYRKNFGWLVKFYELINQPEKDLEELNEIAKALSGKFPDKKELRELKLLLFGNQNCFIEDNIELENPLYIKPLADENLLLEYLLKTNYSDFLDIENLSLTKRFNLLWKDFPQHAEDILIHLSNLEELNELQTAFLAVSAKSITQSLFNDLLAKNIHLGEILLRSNPWLAINKEVWSYSNKIQDKIFEALIIEFSNKTSKSDITLKWQEIVWSMLDAQNDIYSYRIYELFGDRLIDWVLDWHSNNSNNKLNSQWKTILLKSYESLMNWVVNNKDKTKTKSLIAQMINPNLGLVKHYGSFPWLDLANNDKRECSKSEKLKINGFLLGLGFANTDSNSKVLVVNSFSSIYNATESNELPQDVWNCLEPVVPTGGFFFGWDKCRRLEEAVINLILEYGWGIEIILEIAQSEHIFIKLINRANDYSRGRKSLWKLKNKVDAGKLNTKRWQRKILDSYFRE